MRELARSNIIPSGGPELPPKLTDCAYQGGSCSTLNAHSGSGIKKPGFLSRSRVLLDPSNYRLLTCTGWLNVASPRTTSAKAHQICTLLMSCTYAGTVMLR